MSAFTVFVVALFLVNGLPVIASIHEDHESGHGHGAFDNILESINVTNSSLLTKDIPIILERLAIHDCSNKTSGKHKCVKAEALLEFFNVSANSTVLESEFDKMATVMIYCLLPSEDDHDHDNDHDDHDNDHDNDHDDHDNDHDDHDHDNDHDDHDNDNDHDDVHDDDHDDDHETDKRFVTEKLAVFKEVLERYNTTSFCEQVLDQLLKDINDTIGDQLSHETQCFSSLDILHELSISEEAELTTENFEEMCTVVVSKLLNRHCIHVRHKEHLPCPSFFAENLFQRFAVNNTITTETLEQLLTQLKIGKHQEPAGEHTEDEDDPHAGHDHRRRRDVSMDISQFPWNLDKELAFGAKDEPRVQKKRRFRREVEDHEDHEDDHGHEMNHEKCFSAEDILEIYNVKKNAGINLEKFKALSSGLFHQVATNACVVEPAQDSSKDTEVGYDKAKVWGYGLLAVAIVSICSVIGLAIIPFMKTIAYKRTVVFLISLAVGTLVGDALLHLLPHAAGLHGDSHDHGESSEPHDRSYLWKFLVVVAGVYAFFLFETITHLFLRKSIGHSHSVEHTRRHSQFAEHDHKHAHDCHETEIGVEEHGNQSVVMANKSVDKNELKMDYVPAEKKTASQVENADAKKAISSVAWMIIIGDTIHNIADGIAIGVAFTDSINGGISTSIAVFCHELPHELGDFAVLLSAGMSVKKALLANFLSALSCFVGLVIGVLVGGVEDANQWIFAMTAGFFIYIALTDMLPELMHSSSFSVISKGMAFGLQNLGMLTGFGIMILLAYYEEEIRV